MVDALAGIQSGKVTVIQLAAMSTVKRVAVLGGGTVGGEFVSMLRNRVGGSVEITGVLVRDTATPRSFEGWQQLVTTDDSFVQRSDIVVEVMGGTERAADLSLAALQRGATLVTANKAALAERWSEYLPYMRQGRVFFEAAVMAGTPVVGPLSWALRGSQPGSLHAVLNGTCNVVLAAMDEGADYAEALADAQRAGFAEADPTLDVEGIDAAHKLTVLGRLAFDPDMSWPAVKAATTGISGLSAATLAEARTRGKHVRLVGTISHDGQGWTGKMRPVELPEGHALNTVGPGNAFLFIGAECGRVSVRGAGAGGATTASGVLGDVLAALAGQLGPVPVASAAPAPAGSAGGDELVEVSRQLEF